MSKRRYTTSCLNFEIWLTIKGERKIISFGGKDILTKQRYLDTEDKEIQKALESNPFFGVYFTKSIEYDWMELEEKPKEAHAVVEEIPKLKTDKTLIERQFKNITEAKQWINKNHNVPYSKMKTKEQLVSEFANIGYQLILSI